MRSDPLPWREPRALARVLARHCGRDGLVLLDGDGSALGCCGVLGVQPVATMACRGLPGTAGAGDPFEALAAMDRAGRSLAGLAGLRGRGLGGAGRPLAALRHGQPLGGPPRPPDPLRSGARNGSGWRAGIPGGSTAMAALLEDPATHAAVAAAEARRQDGEAIPRGAGTGTPPRSQFAARWRSCGSGSPPEICSRPTSPPAAKAC